MDSTQKLIEKLVERRMQNTRESQAVATANVLAAFEKLKRNEDELHSLHALGTHLAERSGVGTRRGLVVTPLLQRLLDCVIKITGGVDPGHQVSR